MMDFKEFQEVMKDRIKDYLPPKYADAEITITRNEKLNDSYTAMMVRPEGENIVPMVNLDSLYRAYEKGGSMESILRNAAEVVTAALPEVVASGLHDYDEVKERLFIRLSGAAQNADLLAKLPHTMQEDLAITYHVSIADVKDGIAATPVTYEMLDDFGVSLEQLHADAMANGEKMYPLKIDSVDHILEEMMRQEMRDHGMDEEEISVMISLFQPKKSEVPMAVVSNNQHINGAAAMFYQATMEKVSEQLGGSFHILPASVHEMFVIPDRAGGNIRELKAIVTEINATQLAPQDRLTDEVYHYDSADKVFEKAASYEERMAAKQAGKEKREQESGHKPSILKKLDEKKEQAKEMVPMEAKPGKHRTAEEII